MILWNKISNTVVQFAIICLLIGPLSFLIGQLLPRERFDYAAFPYNPFAFERNGDIYLLLRIHKWKDKAPDMSKIIRGVFKKKLGLKRDAQYMLGLIRETCVAEFVHMMLILASPIFLFMFDGWKGFVAMGLYAFFNLPFIMIQRYNRPRLVAVLQREIKREAQR